MSDSRHDTYLSCIKDRRSVMRIYEFKLSGSHFTANIRDACKNRLSRFQCLVLMIVIYIPYLCLGKHFFQQ